MFLLLLCCMPYYLHSFPLPRRLVDMTYTFDDKIKHYSLTKGFQLDVVMNGTEMNGVWMLGEEYSSSIHLGTHMDAPSHFPPGGLTIDELPLEHFFAPAAVIDITEKARLDPDAEAIVEDLLTWECLTEKSLNGTIVLLKSGWGMKWNNETAFLGTSDRDFFKAHFPGFSAEAAAWLVENRTIYGVGTEAISFDTGKSKIFPAHQTFLRNGIFGLENVANLDKIPISGAHLYVIPMKIAKASGAPTRIIASYVAPEMVQSAPGIVPSAAETVPDATEIIPGAPEAVPDATEIVTVASEMVTVAIEIVTDASEIIISAPEIVQDAPSSKK